jgi:predicted DNA-binding antitoxin AbrB/MazE fold protein
MVDSLDAESAMKTIHAIFQMGVFRPTETVDLPENAQVEFEPRVVEPTVAEMIEKVAQTDPGLAAIYEVMARQHSSGHTDTAARHNEHQP